MGGGGGSLGEGLGVADAVAGGVAVAAGVCAGPSAAGAGSVDEGQAIIAPTTSMTPAVAAAASAGNNEGTRREWEGMRPIIAEWRGCRR